MTTKQNKSESEVKNKKNLNPQKNRWQIYESEEREEKNES